MGVLTENLEGRDEQVTPRWQSVIIGRGGGLCRIHRQIPGTVLDAGILGLEGAEKVVLGYLRTRFEDIDAILKTREG